MLKPLTTAAALMLASAAIAQEAPQFAVTFENGVVTPNSIEIPANTEVVLTVTNAGDATAEFESKPLHIEQVVAAGMTVTIHLRSLTAGVYDFVDEFTEDLKTAHGQIVAK